MTSDVINQIRALDDVDVVEFFDYFSQKMLNGVDDLDQLVEEIPPAIRSMPEFSEIDRLSMEEEEVKLDTRESVAIARNLLETLAQEPSLSAIVQKTLEMYKAEMEAGDRNPILSVTLAASMILVVATTKISIKIGGVTFEKNEATPALIGETSTLLLTLPQKKYTSQQTRGRG
ncbi:hypothetical protein [Nostoc sp. FACHB-133]|uniref:hypothetical protein n=1 Tax=Nostoc sp. FACHB-133 TaxID=2692835 RepID=UPI0016892C45|nr:hypothetical protein [Nostoc sp. FACHB-133]MBD2521723.1 hypothetical protein [Nostoc sp. FACHB-133]